uniref:hypothetical protein n=1 Tax=Spirosoma sp. TaxID=1899569 RepID=UPI003B3B85E2
ASFIAFKAKTVLIKSFENVLSPLMVVPKNNIDRIVLSDGTVLTAGDILKRQSPADQLALFIKQEAARIANDDGSFRPVAYERSNFLGKSITLVSARNTAKHTILTFVRRQDGLTRFVISSATYLYNRQDIRQAFRLINAGSFDIDVPITVPAGVDSLQYDLCFERVPSDVEEINFKSLPITAGALGGPVGGYFITKLAVITLPEDKVGQSPAKSFGTLTPTCITCGGIGIIRCSECAGNKTVMVTRQIPATLTNNRTYRTITESIRCPLCQGNGNYLCANRPNHPELP